MQYIANLIRREAYEARLNLPIKLSEIERLERVYRGERLDSLADVQEAAHLLNQLHRTFMRTTACSANEMKNKQSTGIWRRGYGCWQAVTCLLHLFIRYASFGERNDFPQQCCL